MGSDWAGKCQFVMKITIINPDYGVTEEQRNARCKLLQKFVGPDVELSMLSLRGTRVEINSMCEAALAGPEIINLAVQAERNGADAVVLYCFSDPVIEACRERLAIPVVGGAQAACLFLPVIARQGVVVLANAERIPEKKLFLARTGLAPERIQNVEAIEKSGLDGWEQREQVFAELLKTGRRLIEDQQAQCLVLGCLAYLGLAPRLSDELGIPVIDPAAAAVSQAEALVRQGLRTSKKAYPVPAVWRNG